MPNLASQRRAAFSSIVSNTGSRSPGERLMTLSTSDGGGLLLQIAQISCARSSLSSRVFSMAMTAWSAKFLTSSICFSVNGLYVLLRETIAPTARLR